jgi:Icc protein
MRAEAAPGSAHQVKLVLGPERGPWIAEPPAMLLHVWNEADGLVTHTHFIGDFAPEGRFEDPHFSRT